MSDGVKAHPEVVEKLRDVSVAARTIQRDQVPGGRRRRGRLPLRARPRRSSPARRSSSTAASTSIEALAVPTFETGVETGRRQPRRLRPRRRRGPLRRGAVEGAGARLAARRRRVDAEGALLSRRVQLDPYAAWVVRCDRIDFPPGGVAYLHTHPGPGIRYLLHGGSSKSTPRAARRPTAPGGAWFEARPRPGRSPRRRRTSATAFVRVLVLPRRVGRQADDPLRRPADDDRPRLAEGDRPARAAIALRGERPAAGSSSTSSRCTAPTSRSASRARATSRCSTRSTTRRSGFVTCRHEGGAANMAEAYGKLTGRPGICLVTRGPGATHAAVGMHTAYQDSTPLILFVGQVPREDRGARGVPGDRLPPHVRPDGEVGRRRSTSAERIPELIARAFHVATSGRPGPGRARAARGHARRDAPTSPDARAVRRRRRSGAADAAVERRASCSPAPSVRSSIVGGGALERGGRARLSRPGARRAASCRSPAALRCQDYVDNDARRCYAGHLGVGADPALARARRATPTCCSSSAPASARSTTRRLHAARPARPEADARPRPSRPRRARPRLRARPRRSSGLPELRARSRRCRPRAGRAAWRRDRGGARRLPREPRAPCRCRARRDGRGDGAPCARGCRPDAILTNGAGNFTVWAHRFYEFRRYRHAARADAAARWATALPAAIAAKLVAPGAGRRLLRGRRRLPDDRPGARDGACSTSARVVVLVVNNGMYGTIRMHQERALPRSRQSAPTSSTRTSSRSPRAFGAYGERVERTEDVRRRVRPRARCGRPPRCSTFRSTPRR